MKTRIIYLLISVLGIFPLVKLYAQPTSGKVIEEMQKFSWMTGDWKGDAWYMDRDQKKVPILQKENIFARLDGAILTMEGTGYSVPVNSGESAVVFQAFGILTYNLQDSKYVIRAYQGGYYTDSELILNEDGSYTWGIDMPYGKTRFTISLTQDGKWNERGEFSRDGGGTWVQTFEMTLTKVN